MEESEENITYIKEEMLKWGKLILACLACTCILVFGDQLGFPLIFATFPLMLLNIIELYSNFILLYHAQDSEVHHKTLRDWILNIGDLFFKVMQLTYWLFNPVNFLGTVGLLFFGSLISLFIPVSGRTQFHSLSNSVIFI